VFISTDTLKELSSKIKRKIFENYASLGSKQSFLEYSKSTGLQAAIGVILKISSFVAQEFVAQEKSKTFSRVFVAATEQYHLIHYLSKVYWL
jgi:hypothetical protein